MGSTSSKPLDSQHNEHNESNEKTINTQLIQSSLSTLSLSDTIPLAPQGELTLDCLAAWEHDLADNSKAQLARTILAHTNIQTALVSRSATVADAHLFSHEVDFKTGPVTDQKRSGRCWLFATTNVLRYEIMKKLSLQEFQLSQSYLFFYDKLNKANYYLELAIENAHLPVDDRLVNFLAGDLISDGGQWDMAVNLLEKYGIVPQSIYPESTHSSSSGPLNSLLKSKLREHSLILRRLSVDLKERSVNNNVAIKLLRVKKEALMKEVYAIMTATLGVPPLPDKKFKWEYYANGKFNSWEGTPVEYFQMFASKPYQPKDSFSLINDPRNEYSKLYTVDKLGNIWGGRPVTYVNTEIEVMKATVVKMIKAGIPVFFGCDVGKFSDSQFGIMDPDLFTYKNAFDITLGLTKAERLEINESAMTHAMVISGVHLDENGKPVRYKVENSWGDVVGNKGYYVMTDKWFEQFTYQIVVPKALAPKELVKVYEGGNPTVFPPWDPMGTLA